MEAVEYAVKIGLPRAQVCDEVEAGSPRRDSVDSICSCRFMVGADVRIEDVAEDFQRVPDMAAVAVVDGKGIVLGIVSREQLMRQLGKPFGREVLKRRPIAECAKPARCFKASLPVVCVGELVAEDLASPHSGYFAVISEEGGFRGLVSTHDILLYYHATMTREIGLAERVQGHIMGGDALIEGEGFEIARFCSMAKGVGGDYCAASRLPDGRIFVALSDVSGKGLSASLISAILSGICSVFDYRRGLAAFIGALNRYILDTFRMERFLTGVFGFYDPASASFDFCDLGHSLLFVSKGGKVHPVKLKDGNMPLGVEEGLEPKLHRIRIRPGEGIIMFTDGVIERRSESGAEFGRAGFAEFHAEHAHLSAPEFARALSAALDAFAGSLPANDDTSFLFIKAR
jgi:sigma-B regulation protein RsbU (phosphoserine phosphatase)